jgi:hypothetical protein
MKTIDVLTITIIIVLAYLSFPDLWAWAIGG